ncbi:MAG TPA: DUF933 domain-containing protein [Syntrophorhabdaceae bacterium]|nr:DUF933 domain-containing protein [Syntrophorhabdaceae bacterium]HON85425.1 DUF933 domain-containing protein [Syntrophorhabdaceae bacterium]HOT42285.1 DUF933 domain-containing protein [Syntrophorhabdaceae bacterium]HPC66976.1 DUF933 domain-containing protein [Syntrophorhabdaceae bacterium]HPP42403.1 DUF933 domain-containing protein [Syntrophorhabdaceae bacterium]
MYISIIGKAGSGKTTFFHALSRTPIDGKTGSSNISIIDVPDERLEELSRFFKTRKTVHARIELTDTPSLNSSIFQQIRQSDAFILVLPYFEDTMEDLGQGYRSVMYDFILSDMAQVEQRLERIAKQGGKRENPMLQQEKELLEVCLSHLNEEKPLMTLQGIEEKMRHIRGFQFLSQKPMMILINCSEDRLSEAVNIEDSLKKDVHEGIPCVAACARLEAELSLMSDAEQGDFMTEYGIKESIRGKIIRLACDTLGLISFFTVGEDECRAWHLKKGETAHEAARTIHTDFYNKFIRAEVVSYDDFFKYNGFAGCKKAGAWRLEGKTYIVKDGDIITIRAGA